MNDSNRFELLHENLKIKVENRSLSSELEETKKQKEFLIREYNQLRTENEKLKEYNTDLLVAWGKENEKLKAENIQLNKYYKDLYDRTVNRTEYYRLKNSYDKQIESLNKEIEQLKAKLRATQSEPMKKYACDICQDTKKLARGYFFPSTGERTAIDIIDCHCCSKPGHKPVEIFFPWKPE